MITLNITLYFELSIKKITGENNSHIAHRTSLPIPKKTQIGCKL